jgi:hypothetical protein
VHGAEVGGCCYCYCCASLGETKQNRKVTGCQKLLSKAFLCSMLSKTCVLPRDFKVQPVSTSDTCSAAHAHLVRE